MKQPKAPTQSPLSPGRDRFLIALGAVCLVHVALIGTVLGYFIRQHGLLLAESLPIEPQLKAFLLHEIDIQRAVLVAGAIGYVAGAVAIGAWFSRRLPQS